MGKIFSPESITTRSIPEDGAHELAGRFIMEELFGLKETDGQKSLWNFGYDSIGVHSGMVYGSTALGRTTLRSDVDVLVNYRPEQSDTALPKIQKVFSQAEQNFHVPIEAHILDVNALSDPLRHNIDPLFAEHLCEVQAKDKPLWSYNWPVQGLEDHLVEPGDIERLRAIAIRYTSGKARHFAQAIVGYRGVVDLQIMQRAFELPGAIGRKVLAIAREEGEEMPDLSNKAQMAVITLNRLQELGGIDHKAVESHRMLAELDQEYDELLGAALSGRVSVEEYRAWLNSYYLQACDSALTVADVWCDIVSSQQRTAEGQGVSNSTSDSLMDFEVY